MPVSGTIQQLPQITPIASSTLTGAAAALNVTVTSPDDNNSAPKRAKLGDTAKQQEDDANRQAEEERQESEQPEETVTDDPIPAPLDEGQSQEHEPDVMAPEVGNVPVRYPGLDTFGREDYPELEDDDVIVDGVNFSDRDALLKVIAETVGYFPEAVRFVLFGTLHEFPVAAHALPGAELGGATEREAFLIFGTDEAGVRHGAPQLIPPDRDQPLAANIRPLNEARQVAGNATLDVISIVLVRFQNAAQLEHLPEWALDAAAGFRGYMNTKCDERYRRAPSSCVTTMPTTLRLASASSGFLTR